jgi:IS30 family transposase
MGTRYQQLSLEDRCAIANLHAQGGSLRQIAAALSDPERRFRLKQQIARFLHEHKNDT